MLDASVVVAAINGRHLYHNSVLLHQISTTPSAQMRTMDVVAGGGPPPPYIVTIRGTLRATTTGSAPARGRAPDRAMSRARRVDRPYSVAHTSARGQSADARMMARWRVYHAGRFAA